MILQKETLEQVRELDDEVGRCNRLYGLFNRTDALHKSLRVRVIRISPVEGGEGGFTSQQADVENRDYPKHARQGGNNE